jgi:hypothetical protein
MKTRKRFLGSARGLRAGLGVSPKPAFEFRGIKPSCPPFSESSRKRNAFASSPADEFVRLADTRAAYATQIR